MQKQLLIGSVAAYHWLSGKVEYRVPRDIDILTPASISSSSRHICNIETQWHDLAEEIIETSKDKVFCDLDLLYTLKVSHAYWDIHWQKTTFDIVTFNRFGVTINQDLHDGLVKMWSVIHGPKKVNLNKKVDEFFTEHVKRAYDHEILHELVAFNQKPMHTLIRPDLQSVWVDKGMFFDLPFEKQIETALEEMMVVAIERGQLNIKSPNLVKVSALHKAHKLLVTSMTKGWFAQFLVENIENLLGNQTKKRCLDKINSVLQLLETAP